MTLSLGRAPLLDEDGRLPQKTHSITREGLAASEDVASLEARVVTQEGRETPTADTISGATDTGKSLLKSSTVDAARSLLGAVSADRSAVKFNAATLLSSIGSLRNPIPAITTDAPTITYATATSVTSPQVISPQSTQLNRLGHPGTWNPSFSRQTVTNVHGLGFDLIGTTVEIHFFVGGANTPIWIWVDGRPVTATPYQMSNAGSAETFVKLVFPTAVRRSIEFYSQSNNAWRAVRTTATGVVSPSQVKPAVAFVGDSFFAGDTTTFTPPQLTAAAIAGRSLGVDFHVRAVGGTGYSTANGFGSAARVASVAAIPNLRAIVISGSVNDDTSETVGADAATTYAAYKAACPGVPIIVFGPQPSSATETVSINRGRRNTSVRASALAADNVIGFADMIGSATGTDIEAYSSSVAYTDGTRVSRNGSVYEFSNGGTAQANQDPATSTRWRLVTWLYTGTGNTGTPAGNGTRDVVLYLDNVHPTTEGSFALGSRQASVIIEILIAFVRSVQ